jgi:hypothetical protein
MRLSDKGGRAACLSCRQHDPVQEPEDILRGGVRRNGCAPPVASGGCACKRTKELRPSERDKLLSCHQIFVLIKGAGVINLMIGI